MRAVSRTILALSPALAAILGGCAVFRAQHSSELYSPKAAAAVKPAAVNPNATLARVQAEIFTPKCAIPECHVTAAPGAEEGPPEGLVLEAGKSHENIVGVRAHEMDLMRIAPGDPDNSFVVRKVTPGARIAWHPMPLDKPPLTDAERQLLRDWVAAGAPNK